MFQKVKELDTFASPFNFFLEKKKSKQYKTAWGGIGTLIRLISFAVISYIFVGNYLDRSQPEVSVNSKIATRDSRMDIYFRRFFMIFLVLDEATPLKVEESKRFMTVHAYRQTLTSRRISSLKRGLFMTGYRSPSAKKWPTTSPTTSPAPSNLTLWPSTEELYGALTSKVSLSGGFRAPPRSFPTQG